MYDVLKGIKVVEAAEWVFVPTAAAILADWGADVIKVENPARGDAMRGLSNSLTVAGGDRPWERPMIEQANRGKRNVAIDISSSKGREILYRLLEDADVFLTSYRPSAREKLGITREAIAKVNPNLIYVSGTAWGSRGEKAGLPGFDLAQSWAAGGIAYQMTHPGDSEPAQMPSSVGDMTGGLSLAGGVSLALFHRERTGEAREVETSLYNVGMWLTGQWITAAQVGGEAPPGMKRADMPHPLMGSYPTKDNRWLWLVFPTPDRWWPDLCEHLGKPDLATDPRFVDMKVRYENRDECVSLLEEIFRTKTLAEWGELFRTLEGVWAPVASPKEIGSDPQALENGYFPEAKGPDGSMRVVAAPIQLGGEPVGELRTMSEFGADTEVIMLEAGFTWDDIEAYKSSGAIF